MASPPASPTPTTAAAARPTITQGSSATTTLAFNDANELLSETYGGTSPLAGLTVTNAYDTCLRRNALVFQQSNNPLIQQSFGYDAASRLQTVTDAQQQRRHVFLPCQLAPGAAKLPSRPTARRA